MSWPGVFLSVAICSAPQVLTPPYLQNVGTDHITILCEIEGCANPRIEYGVDTAYGTEVTAERSASWFGNNVFRSTLTGLEPGTQYHFHLVLDGVIDLEDRTFTTAPAESTPFTFGVWSDSQGTNHDACPSDPLAPTAAMFDHMLGQGVDFAVGAGDLSEFGDFYWDISDFYLDRVAATLGQRVPYFIAWGNHDLGPFSLIRNYVDLPSALRDGFTSGWGSYSFDYAGCHFICIDDSTRKGDVEDWLESDLQSEANQNAKFTFLFVHQPPFCDLWVDGEPFLREHLVPLMEKYGVDACFSGHTHEYERGYSNGVFYCVTGGGSWLDTPEELVHDWPHITVGGYHDLPGYSHGLVNEYLRIKVGASSWTATMHAFDPCGNYIGVLDQFGSVAPPPNVAVPPENFQCVGAPIDQASRLDGASAILFTGLAFALLYAARRGTVRH